MPGSASKRKPSQYDPELDFGHGRPAIVQEGRRRLEVIRGKHPVGGHSRRQSKDAAWVDIPVSDGRRMGGQEAGFRNGQGVSPPALPGSPERYQEYFPAFNKSESRRTPRTSLARARSDPEIGATTSVALDRSTSPSSSLHHRFATIGEPLDQCQQDSRRCLRTRCHSLRAPWL